MKTYKKNTKSVKIICKAMKGLCIEKEFSKISITELCIKAGLARKTFYMNFSSKEDVIRVSIDTMMTEFSIDMEISKNKYIDGYPLIVQYFRFWYERKEFLVFLVENNLFDILNNEYDIYINMLANIKVNKIENDKISEYSIIFLSGGYWNILRRWIKTDFLETPESLARIIMKYFEK